MHALVPPTSPGHTHALNMITHMYSHRHAFSHALLDTHTHMQPHADSTFFHTHTFTHRYNHSDTYTHSHHHQDCPLFQLCPLGRRTKDYQVAGIGGTGPPYPFPVPTPIAEGSSYSPAWSGCHAGRGLPPEPPCGRRTSRRHSLLQENREEAMGHFRVDRPTGAGAGGPGWPESQTSGHRASQPFARAES